MPYCEAQLASHHSTTALFASLRDQTDTLIALFGREERPEERIVIRDPSTKRFINDTNRIWFSIKTVWSFNYKLYIRLVFGLLGLVHVIPRDQQSNYRPGRSILYLQRSRIGSEHVVFFQSDNYILADLKYFHIVGV